ncbi:thiamine pyrophosphate-binding protein, partial [Bacteroides caecigallinarum]|uniref:thiamine pyrophosphate-binding protein n=1 Tax=Bacteroides caecigallinarum TaxID=1411144 RepID=UPI0021D48673
MYTILENARIVISLLKKHNIRHIVLSPGGSNIPITQGVQNDSFFKCYSVVDERSAMYFAIGLYLQTGEIIATSCTSAQATRNYVPGLTEAYYKHVPILAITMSKHPMYLSQDYMQCPIQTSLPIDSVKKSFSLPCINSIEDRYQCIRTTNEAILELTHNGKGPVQLNIEELDSQTWKFDKNLKTLPDVRCIKRFYSTSNLDNELNGKKVMLLIGEHLPFSSQEQDSISRFCKKHNVLVYTNHISNFKNDYSLNGNIVA